MIKKIFVGALVLLPFAAFAQLSVGTQDATGIVKFIQESLNVATGLILAFAVVYLMYGIFQFVKAEGEEREEGRSKMIYGIIGIAVMVSIWGLVKILVNTAGTGNSTTPVPPPVLPTFR